MAQASLGLAVFGINAPDFKVDGMLDTQFPSASYLRRLTDGEDEVYCCLCLLE
jgi:hypothetical protein